MQLAVIVEDGEQRDLRTEYPLRHTNNVLQSLAPTIAGQIEVINGALPGFSTSNAGAIVVAISRPHRV